MKGKNQSLNIIDVLQNIAEKVTCGDVYDNEISCRLMLITPVRVNIIRELQI